MFERFDSGHGYGPGPSGEKAGVGGVWVIVVAAGSGSRFGARKQFLDLSGRSVIDRAVAEAVHHAEGVVVVLPGDRAGAGLGGRSPTATPPRAVRVVTGGSSRSDSVRRGLAAVPPDAEVVVVHDGARPLASAELYRRVVAAVREGADGAVPVVEVTDTVRRHGVAFDRRGLVAVQTPQGFRAGVLRAALAEGGEATDDATLVEATGATVVEVEGDRGNLKITTPEDLTMAAALLGEADEPSGLRVGHGFDVHRYSDDPDRVLVLGGVRFEGERGLAGHSDADVVAHACIEALLGAAGLGDIGSMFPDTDPALAGADSIDLLLRTATALRETGWSPVNVDCSVVLDAPVVRPHVPAMQRCLGDAAGAAVTVSGRRPEGVGALGRGEGVAAWAVALVARRPRWRQRATTGTGSGR